MRPSQLQHTFGIGAIVDLPRVSALIMGLDEWDINQTEQVTEERLLAAVQERAGAQVTELRLPPYVPEERGNPFGEWTRVGVPVEVFPRFLRCPACRHLGPIESSLFKLKTNRVRTDLVRVVHEHCPKSKTPPTAIPVRFMLACEAGHLDDFPWDYYVHAGASCGKTLLQFGERGVSGDAASIFVRCVGCDTPRSMAPAFGRDAGKHLPRCRGRHPHLRSFAEAGCAAPPRAIGLGASNLWFPYKVSVVSIPQAEDPLLVEVERNWAQLGRLASVEQVAGARGFAPEKFIGFGPATDAEIWAAIGRYRALSSAGPSSSTAGDVLGPEWEVFADHRRAPKDHPDFRIEPREVPAEWRDDLVEVLAVTRLREVSALLGFTRIVAPNELAHDASIGASVAPLANTAPRWVPCAETRGEGVFLRLPEGRLTAWADRVADSATVTGLWEGYRQWCDQRSRDPEPHWASPRYVLLHSLSHALIRAFALECGYSASGIRERIYARDGMAGILLYTAAPDSEGTLGGLVRLAEPEMLTLVLKQALRDAALCSSDPMCAEHRPEHDRTVHGAACHACLFAAETSCERGNRFLDRKLLVPTFAGGDTAFFALP